MARRFALRRPDDPLYPCTAVAPRYQSSCYGMQAGIIVETTGPDFEKVADACDRAPPSMRPSCYLGIGTYLSGVTVRDPERAIAECSKGAERYRAWCFVGVVKNFIDVTANVDDGRQFCERITDHDIRVTCFTAVGQQVLALHPSPPDRERKCSAMPADFTGACRYGARLVTDRPEGLPPEWP